MQAGGGTYASHPHPHHACPPEGGIIFFHGLSYSYERHGVTVGGRRSTTFLPSSGHHVFHGYPLWHRLVTIKPHLNRGERIFMLVYPRSSTTSRRVFEEMSPGSVAAGWGSAHLIDILCCCLILPRMVDKASEETARRAKEASCVPVQYRNFYVMSCPIYTLHASLSSSLARR